MTTQSHSGRPISETGKLMHPLTVEDAETMAALRAFVAPNKGRLRGTAARESFNGIMEQVAAPSGVTFHSDVVGGISGWWCEPVNTRSDSAILHLHGGWFHWGTALAYRNIVGQIALRAGVAAFIPDYRLAPEHPFPAAVDDVLASYRAMSDGGKRRIAVTGDSAGGNLALVLLSLLGSSGDAAPVGAVALSPVTDLTVSGSSYDTRGEADPYFTKPQVIELVGSYLGGIDPKDPLASPLYGNLAGLPKLRIHVGEDEVLLDDSLRYFENAIAAGVDVKLDVWQGMPHGFVNGIGRLSAAAKALDAIGLFLADCFATAEESGE